MIEEVKDSGSVFGEEVRNVLGVELADRPNHVHALEAVGPIFLHEGVDIVEQCLIELGRSLKVLEFHHSDLNFIVLILHWF